MIFNRIWAMPSRNTFSIKPIHDFVMRYLSASKVSVDPFARDCLFATYTNDLNQNTVAQYHMDAVDFLSEIVSLGVRADLVLFDPPYSPRQIKECYDGIYRSEDGTNGCISHSLETRKGFDRYAFI
jgi:hypothetical protein